MTQNVQELKKGYQDEITFQQHMLQNLQRYQIVFSVLASIGILLVCFFYSRVMWLFISGIVLIVINTLLVLIVGYAIYRGKNNLNKVIAQYESVIK